MALLHPQDLLNLSRISKHFRKILMHRSSKGMWAAARKNANNMPAPPDVLSEPKYASLLFERECQASNPDTSLSHCRILYSSLVMYAGLWYISCRQSELCHLSKTMWCLLEGEVSIFVVRC